MDLGELAKNWDSFGREDPLWAVLTDNKNRHGKWDLEEFRRKGTEQIDATLAFLEQVPIDVARTRALDFGCGPGRLTQALCDHFDVVDGVDIADSMIGLAREWNEFGDRCQYHVNPRADLEVLGDARYS